MRKTLGNPGFLSGEAKNRTFRCFTNVLGEFEKHIDLASRSWCTLVCRTLLRGQLDKKRGDCPRLFHEAFEIFGDKSEYVVAAPQSRAAANTAMGWKNANLRSEMTGLPRRGPGLAKTVPFDAG